MTSSQHWTLAGGRGRSADPTQNSEDDEEESRLAAERLSRLFSDSPGGTRLPPRLRTAGFGARAWALALNLLILQALAAPLLWLAYGAPVTRLDDLRPLNLLCNLGLPALYLIGFWAWQGATPGQLIAGVRVVDAHSGARPRLAQSALRGLGYLLSALPLGLGFVWAAIDAEGQAWHDKLAGTRVVRRRAAAPDADEPSGYFAAHWRGEQSLAQSFWVNNVLLSLPLGLALTGLMAWISLKGETLQAGSIAVLIGWPLLAVFDTWCIVGAWRAASAYRRIDGSGLWATLAQLVLALGVLQLGASALFGFLPSIGDYLQMARGIDPIGQASFQLSGDGRTLRLNGPIGMGDARRMQQQLEAAPAVRLFELASPGGRLFEAERMVALVRSRQGSTRAVGGCESACTLVFLAGAQRQLMPGARLGFHRASSGTYNPLVDEAANQHLAESYRAIGLPESFIQRTTRTPAHSMWYPHSEELISHQLVAMPPRTLDAALPQEPRLATAIDFAEALRGNPAWFQLEQRYPGLLDAAAQRMLAQREAGAAALQAAAQAELATHMPELIQGAEPEPRRRYARLLGAQLGAAQQAQPARCQALLDGRIEARRGLGAALDAQESAWLIEAATAAPPRRLPGPATALEREVMRRTVGEAAIGLLGGVWSGGARAGARPGCEQTLQILSRIAALPPAQRELAERLLFQAPG